MKAQQQTSLFAKKNKEITVYNIIDKTVIYLFIVLYAFFFFF